ncbi:hypothetical protein GCM10027169_34480 [Gordonia jinhuaensis]|uniref:Uncharacterized protein n=1 Tax=Gordonia jinhuaensis TaxID=1517702 RepID=A0A916WUF1_9ACTN|nr:hypothetical protein [Gordonia jinhuaensis]GGB30744.1 hypothetical protein GCM10011489_18650 [Gordonia jinhuaensis]
MDDAITVLGLVVVIGTLVVVAMVVVSMLFTSGTKCGKVEPYTLDKEWKHNPQLFSATDIEPVAGPEHEHDDAIGGSASGKW